MVDVLAQRRMERERLLGLARTYVARLSARLPLEAAVVVGSVARGDYNVWSDVDVLVIAEDLPARAPDRSALLGADAPPGVQVIGYTAAEFGDVARKGNPLAREAVTSGVVIAGEAFMATVSSGLRR